MQLQLQLPLGRPIAAQHLTKELGSKKVHVEWLVRYQVVGEGYDELAESLRKAVSTVRLAVENLREFLRLPKRRGRGRPQGSKSRGTGHIVRH
jgi:hypothetical protein